MNRDAMPDPGLTGEEAARRLVRDGPNALRREAQRPAWRMLVAQYASPVIGMLLVASVVSLLMGETADAVAMACILVINGVVGFAQEYRAERAITALRSLTAPRARVLRDGRGCVIAAADVVRGDVLVLEAGDVVAADAEVIEANRLQANESTLTGESMPVEKSATAGGPEAVLAERPNRLYMGTAITAGSGMARVVATGEATELGKVAQLLATAQDTATPLQVRLAKVGQTLMWLCLAIVAVVALIGLLRGDPWQQVLISGVSLAVAAVPEGLPAIVTIALALGVRRMSARRVLVRHMHAIESIGCATVICTDKTGTLTAGVMRVCELWGQDEQALLFAGAACCDAELNADASGGIGDTTEVALLLAAAGRGIRRETIESTLPRTLVLPFDSARKRMSIRRADGVLYVKGGLEAVLACCSAVPPGADAAALDMAGRALRVLAVASGHGEAEEDLTLLGLIGIADPVRPEAVRAVAAARQAGVKTVMITGDHPATARAIGRQLGILDDGGDGESIHARATPEDKLRIVRQWRAKGAVVAMTGDGVNDAPALREAHIGIAMGVSGTEVTREAADMVLADDNFASIVEALREGRGIFDNIRKTVTYLLSGNAAELAIMLGAALLALPAPLLPLHILWINLVTDGLPALALVTDPPESDVLQRPPRRPEEPLIGRNEWATVLVVGMLQAVATLAVYHWALQARGLEVARNLAFTTLVLGELLRAFGARSATRTTWQAGVLENKALLAVIVLSGALQILMHHIPPLQALLQIGPLSVADCAMALLISCLPLVIVDLWKLVRRPATAPSAIA